MRTILAIGRADFRERVRRTSFLVLLVGTVAASYGYLPARTAGYSTFSFGAFGGVYNSAWIGALVAMLDVVVLSLAGFYIVRDAVERDERTGVGQILATTPMTRAQYTCGKVLSNAAVLGCAAAVTLVMGAVMQQLRGEVHRLEVLPLVLPFLVLVIPSVVMVAALAVLFETLRPLRGAPGSVLYFFVWLAVLAIPAGQDRIGKSTPWLDPMGFTAALPSIKSAVGAKFPDYNGLDVNIGVNASRSSGQTRRFVWEGMDWREVVPWRLFWLLVAVAIAGVAALPFHRFDPERMRRPAAPERAATTTATSSARLRWAGLGERLSGRSRWLTVLWAEVAMLTRDRRRGWALVAAGLWVACLFAPYETVLKILLPVAWMWPLAAWAGMGSEEARHRTEALLYTCPHPIRLQLPAAYVAGVLLTSVVGSGAAVRFALARDVGELAAWCVGACFIPALALAAGVLSRGPRLFEATYLLVWYLGLLNSFPVLNFLAPTRGSVGGFLLATLALLAIAAGVRLRRLRQ